MMKNRKSLKILRNLVFDSEEETSEVHEENPVSTSKAIESLINLRSHFQRLGGSEETFLAIQAMERTLLKNKMEENSKQTKITDAFSINSMTLH